MATDILLVGGGIASATAAKTLRDEGFDGSITLVGRELDAPYHRPPLSKTLLLGRSTKDELAIHPPAWWEEAGIDLRTRTNVMALDLDARVAKLQGGDELPFGKVLVATGAMVRRIPLEGSDLDGLHFLRAPGNSASIARDAADATDAATIGGSYIGCEVAASLAAMGKRVTVLMQELEPVERGFGRTVGRWVRERLEARGVTVLGEVEVHGLVGEGRIRAVRLTDGREVPAQVVVAGVGATPDVMLARKSGLEIGELGGVACDATLRAADGVWAAGDVCEYDSVLHGRRVRIEHEQLAADQGVHVARAMLGAEHPFHAVPYFWSDLGDWATIEHVGPAYDADGEEVVGDPSDDAFGVRHLRGRRLVGVTSVNGGADLDAAREELVASLAGR